MSVRTTTTIRKNSHRSTSPHTKPLSENYNNNNNNKNNNKSSSTGSRKKNNTFNQNKLVSMEVANEKCNVTKNNYYLKFKLMEP